VNRRVFEARRDGSVDAALGEPEAGVLRDVAADLLSELDEPGENSVRWFPPAYTDDPAREEEFARMTRDDLVSHKRAAARGVIDSIDAGARRRGVWSARLSPEQAATWAGVLNDARLYLGTKLNITEEAEHEPRAGDDPEAQMHNLYLFLSALQGLLIEELLQTLPNR
jgi:hypothetical protein